MLDLLVTVVLFVVVLGGLVLVHELGHFITARLANVRVLEFGIGFPPRARVLRNRGETVYTLNWLPIGGFVKLEGEDGDLEADPRSFAAQSLVTRLVILAAGVLMNLVVAFVLFAGIAMVGEPGVGIVAGRVQPDSPAQAAGLVDGDIITSVDGRHYSVFGSDIVTGGAGALLADLRASAGRTVVLGLQRTDGSQSTVSATLRSEADVAAGRGALGIEQLGARQVSGSVSLPPAEAIGVGVKRTTAALGLVVDGLAQLGTAIVTRPTEAPPASGPIGIADSLGLAWRELGVLGVLFLAAILSANLAVFNALPIPPLDGGRMLMMVLKALFGARVSLRIERLTYLVGFVVLFAFLIWVTGFDIIRQLGG